MECFSHDRGPVVRMARPENPNEIDEYVNQFCTKLDETGSFQSYCIGHDRGGASTDYGCTEGG